MKTRIDWNRAATSGLLIAKHGTGKCLIITGKLMVVVGFYVHHLGKRLAPYSRPQQ